jgi:LmbE family N-acetylglucosaminyl deacetylase
MAKYAANGAKIYYVIVSDGSKGSEDKNMSAKKLTKIRQREQKDAINILGGKEVVFLDYVDGEVEPTMNLKQDIAREIRRLKPEVVITMDPSMLFDTDMGFINHPDHRAVGQATLDAVFPLARDHMSFPELFDEGFEPHKTPTILLVNFSGEKCNYYEDVTDTFDKKIEAIMAHKSQVTDSKAVEKKIQLLAQKHGKIANCALAEPFIRIDIK